MTFSNNEYVFDNLQSSINKVDLELNKDKISIDYNLIIESQFTGGNAPSEYEKLNEFLNLGSYSKAPCGGFVNIYRFSSNSGKIYYFYSGINEVSNSHYIVTIHKIII